MHTCHYCKTFQKVPSNLRRTEGRNGRKYYYRFCRKKGEEVQADSEVCKDFVPSPYFWCEKDSNWMHVIACLNRDYKCKQKKDVLDAIRGFDIRKEFGMKPVLVKRNVNKPKPVLIRRAK